MARKLLSESTTFIALENRVDALEAGGSGTVSDWGDLGGTLSDQTDLQAALDAKAADSAVVKLTGNQTVAGIKTFSSSPIVPTPSSSTQAANKSYVDSVGGGTTNNNTFNITGGNFPAASGFANAAAIVTYFATSNLPILLDGNVTISAAIVMPANGLFIPGGGKFVKSGSGTLEFQGPGFVGDIPLQVFSGFAVNNVKFTGSYPACFFAEWWGAVGNGSTDDKDALDFALAAMQHVSASGYFDGGILQLMQGKNYYRSTTWDVRRSARILTGAAGDVAWSPTIVSFPANTKGIVLHGTSTFDGTGSTTQTAAAAELEGFEVRGTGGGFFGRGANNSVVSTSGLNVTLTGGSITSVSKSGVNSSLPVPAICPGSTITINGYSYVISNSLSFPATSTIPIEEPRFFIAATNGSATFGDATGGALPSNNDWAGMTVRIDGVNYTISSHTSSLITLTTNFTGTTGVYTATVTTGIKSQTGQNARINIYSGIDVRVQSKLKSITVTGFAGLGVEMHSSKYPTQYVGTEPSGNNCYFERVLCQYNDGSGWAYYGLNSNNFETHSINAENNTGYGFYEEETIGANHFSFHNAYNHKGAFSMTGASAQNNLFGCYTEGGQPSAKTGQYTIIIGGNHGAFFDDYLFGHNQLTCIEGSMLASIGVHMRRYTGWYGGAYSKSVRIGNGPYTSSFPNTLSSLGAGEEDVNTVAGYPDSNPAIPAFNLGYDQLATGWYSFYYGGNYAIHQANSVYAFSGSKASAGPFQLAFPNGFRTAITDPHVKRILSVTATLDFDLTSVASQDLTVTVTGAVVGDVVSLGVPNGSVTADTMFFGWVSAADTVKVRAFRIAGTPNPASGTFRVMVTKF